LVSSAPRKIFETVLFSAQLKSVSPSSFHTVTLTPMAAAFFALVHEIGDVRRCHIVGWNDQTGVSGCGTDHDFHSSIGEWLDPFFVRRLRKTFPYGNNDVCGLA
jgi:hypothetical protein